MGTGCAEKLWSLRPWKYSKSDWTGFWASCYNQLQHGHGGWTRQSCKVPANLSSSHPWNTFWKCLKDKVLENLSLQNSLSNIIQNHCLLGYAQRKQERTNKCFYQDLKIAVTLKTQTYVTCQLPSEPFQCLLTQFHHYPSFYISSNYSAAVTRTLDWQTPK